MTLIVNDINIDIELLDKNGQKIINKYRQNNSNIIDIKIPENIKESNYLYKYIPQYLINNIWDFPIVEDKKTDHIINDINCLLYEIGYDTINNIKLVRNY
jgi:hypothetical protein